MITFLQLDLPSILLGTLAALSCGLLGNFLVLRKQALMGDTISHVVLPGIVVGFLVAGTAATLPMMAGALLAALFAVALIEVIRRAGRIEMGAAMGVVFTTMFAAGVVLLEQSGARSVHLDVEHALYGNLESAIWLEATALSDLADPAKLAGLPESVFRLLGVTGLVIGFILLFYKQLKITSFDPAHADSLGISSRFMGFALVFMTALAAIAAFAAVGSILVIAMFICPAATARMMTDKMHIQIWLSAIVSIASGVIGYVLAAFGPIWLGGENSLSAAGMIALVAGLFQLAAMLFAPRYGLIAKWRRAAIAAP
ncbi:MAG: metal ABC transporter permease [Pseudomonadota bacterium]